jgi:hypothetical protein
MFGYMGDFLERAGSCEGMKWLVREPPSVEVAMEGERAMVSSQIARRVAKSVMVVRYSEYTSRKCVGGDVLTKF